MTGLTPDSKARSVQRTEPPATVIWHDLECGAYRADLPLWRELAREYGDPVLELGAGTGRVSIDLARHGHRVTALDHDPALIAALRERADGLAVEAVIVDAREFVIEERFSLCLVPMQTIQLLDGAAGRGRLLRSVAAHLKPRGAVAIAIAEELELYDGVVAPPPDVCERGSVVYRSQPLSIRASGDGHVLERRREIVALDGEVRREQDFVHLARVSAGDLRREGTAAGLVALPTRSVAATRDYVGSAVVMLGA